MEAAQLPKSEAPALAVLLLSFLQSPEASSLASGPLQLRP